MRCAPLLVAILSTAANLLCVSPVSGEDFRIETDYFIGTEKTPNAEVLTIFQGGNIYDFQLKEPEVTIFEPRRGMITLLNVKRQERTSLSTTDLLDASVSLQAEAVQSNKPVFVAAARPDFQTTTEDFTENNSPLTRLTFAGSPLQYTVIAQAAQQERAAQEYKYFADWSARLNGIRSGLPAEARLELNEALASKNLIPTRIERAIQESRFGRKSEVRTQHLVVWKLSQDDHRRIDETGDQLAKFKLVTFDQYIKPR